MSTGFPMTTVQPTMTGQPMMIVQTVAGQQLWHGDCLQAMGQLPAGAVDVVVTSPPYNIRTAYKNYRDNLPRRRYMEWLWNVGEAVERVLAGDGHFFLNIGGIASDPELPIDVLAMTREYFRLQNWIVWTKSVHAGGRTFGQFKPINSPRYLTQTWECLFHLTKSGDVPIDRLAAGVEYEDRSNLTRFKAAAAGRRCRGNTWWIPYETIASKEEKGHHPAIFPVGLAEQCLKLAGAGPGTVVLDPFVGTGSTLVAARRLGATGLGIDTDREYLEYARRRIHDEATARCEASALLSGPQLAGPIPRDPPLAF